MADYEVFVDKLKEKMAELGKGKFKELMDSSKDELEAFFKDSEDDLKRWTAALAKGELTRDDFEWLVESRQGALEVKLLKLKGIAKVKYDRFKNAIIDTIVDTVFEVFL